MTVLMLSTFSGVAQAWLVTPHEDIGVGDIIYFGSYPQTRIDDVTDLVEGVDYLSAYGSTYLIEPIAWRVLRNEDGEIFLLSQLGLDYAQWYAPGGATHRVWEESSVREWLSEVFLDAAFTASEQNAIVTTLVETPSYFTAAPLEIPGGPDTYDMIFLLSREEAFTASFGFASNTDRICYTTQYAVDNPSATYSASPDYWWLRSPYSNPAAAAEIYTSGVVMNGLYQSWNAVRPAFNLDVSQVAFEEVGEGQFIAHKLLEVVFDPQNGDPNTTEMVIPGQPATDPGVPTKAGFVFDGWWTEPAGGTNWDLADPVTEDMTLYAHWIELFTVTFDAQNSTAPVSTTVEDGSTVAMPGNPTKAGYTFLGWWTEPSGGQLWDFTNDTVTSDITLYGQWIPNTLPPVPPKPPEIPHTGDETLLAPLMIVAVIGTALVFTSILRRRVSIER